jgi:hypothetical protein
MFIKDNLPLTYFLQKKDNEEGEKRGDENPSQKVRVRLGLGLGYRIQSVSKLMIRLELQ